MALGNVVLALLRACQGLIAGRCCLCNAEGHSRVNQGRQEHCRLAENRTGIVVAGSRMAGEQRVGLFGRELRSEPWFLLLSGHRAWTLSATGGSQIHTTGILAD